MPTFNRNLFRLGQIIKTPETERMMAEIIGVCGFTKCEAKMTLNAFQLFVKVLYQTENWEKALRVRLLRGELKFIGFRYMELKNNPNNHVIIRFFNELIRFNSGDASAFSKLEECVALNPHLSSFNFLW